MSLEFATRCIYGNKERFEKDLTGTISFPIYQTATWWLYYLMPEYDCRRFFNKKKRLFIWVIIVI